MGDRNRSLPDWSLDELLSFGKLVLAEVDRRQQELRRLIPQALEKAVEAEKKLH